MLKTNRKLLLTIVIFILSITAIRLVWMNYLGSLNYPNAPMAKDGILDLRHFSFNQHQTLELNGDWEFYPGTLLTTQNRAIKSEKVHVPDVWNESLDTNRSSFRYGSYRLLVLLDENTNQTFGLRLSRVGNASAVFVNGHPLGASGHPSTDVDQHQAKNLPYIVTIPPSSDKLEIVIQVSNHAGDGGIYKPLRFGTIKAIQDRDFLLMGLQLLLCVIALFNSLYGLILYFLGARNKGITYFLAIMILVALSTLISDDKLLFQWMDINYEYQIKMIYATYIGLTAFFPLLFNNLFPGNINLKVVKGYAYYCTLYLLFVVMSPSSYILATSGVLLVSVYLLSIAISTYILIKAVKGRKGGIYLLLASISVGNNMIWSIVQHNSPTIESIHYPFDLIVAILAFTAFWFGQFFHATNQSLQLAEKLRLEDKKKDEFLINTSHELRNPLQGISNVLQVILDDQNHPIHPKQRERVQMARNVSKRMNIMLDDLIEITRLKEKTILLEMKPVYLQTIASGVLDMVKVMLEEKPIQLHVEIDENLPAVLADENRVIQILFNLLHNAVKFTDKGSITVRAIQRNNMAEIQVEDTGIGIPEEALQNIFLPYEQADTKRASGGFGLGLSICKQLVELHHGTLHVSSQLGKGSTFRFTLPFSDERDASGVTPHNTVSIINPTECMVSGAAETPFEAAMFKILIVDDDVINLRVLTQTLEPEGYTITGTASAEQALAEIAKDRYDLVISDVMMPHISGYELTRMIRERFNITELPILLLTARIRTEDIITGFQAGANDYVTKPADAWELRARVRALIELKSSIEDRLRIESAWLQSQIQPHFLYNTLNSIAALSLIDIEKMQTLLHEFSNYLRLSFDFNNASPFVTLEHELSLVRSYIYIEQQRFGNRINVEWNVDKGIEIMVPPLSIQPLVENSIKHGIMNRNRGGTVSIAIQKRTDYVEIVVKDDGIGMNEEQIEQLFTVNPNSGTRSRVGLKNIERRLNQLFQRGLHIQSSPNQGTSVSFQIPLKKE